MFFVKMCGLRDRQQISKEESFKFLTNFCSFLCEKRCLLWYNNYKIGWARAVQQRNADSRDGGAVLREMPAAGVGQQITEV